MIELPYYDKLLQIREILEEYPGFPEKWCGPTTALVSRIIGLGKTAGYYIPSPNSLFYSAGRQKHAWNVDNENWVYIDLSLGQFHERRRRIWILPISTRVLREDLDVKDEYKVICKKDSFIKKVDTLCRLYEEKYGKACPLVGTKSSN